MMVPARFARSAALEYLEYDARLFRWALAIGGAGAGSLLWRGRNKSHAFRILSRVHRSGGSQLATAAIERLLGKANRLERSGNATGLWDFYKDHIRGSLSRSESAILVKNPKALLGYRVLVLKSPAQRERGVIVVDYSYIFPLFAALFDVQTIARRYHIVLEPSWRGLCTADILSYSAFDFPVFVQTLEPRDAAFITNLGANFVRVPLAANWWVDHRVVKPDPRVDRDLDVIMIAAWSAVKRHWRFFRALADLRRRGHRLKVALVGYPMDKTRTQIEDEARHFGVLDQIEVHESLPLSLVASLLARARVHVLWSRKEGANRAMVEALFADVPIIVRQGLSYGHHYPYINPRTGRFTTEEGLGDTLLDVIETRDSFEPRSWAMSNMSCQRATEMLQECIGLTAITMGERWTRPLAVRTVQLGTQQYWDAEDRRRFESDYAFLEGQIRSRIAEPSLTLA